MIRFFFDLVRDGQVTADDDGLLLADAKSARAEASVALAEMARDEFRSDRLTSRLAISVRTGEGPVCEAAFQWTSTALA
jgi:hypothetical protein